MRNIFIGIVLCLIIQFSLIFSFVLIKGQKSYSTYYNFFSAFPNNLTQEYLSYALNDRKVNESLKLVRRQMKILYSNANEKMVKDLLINSYKVFNILESEKDYKAYASFLLDLKEFLGNGYQDYLLEFLIYKTNYLVEVDSEKKDRLFEVIKRIHPSDPNIYRGPFLKNFLSRDDDKLAYLCREYFDAYQVTLPNKSKFEILNYGNFVNKLHLKYGDIISLSNGIEINQLKEYLFLGNFVGDKNLSLNVNLIEGTSLKIDEIKFLKNNNVVKEFKNNELFVTSLYGFFLKDSSYISMDNSKTDKIYIYPIKNSKFPAADKVIIKAEASKLNLANYDCK